MWTGLKFSSVHYLMVSISNEQKIEKDGKKRGEKGRVKRSRVANITKEQSSYSQDRERDISQKRVGLWVGGKRPHICTATYTSPTHVIYWPHTKMYTHAQTPPQLYHPHTHTKAQASTLAHFLTSTHRHNEVMLPYLIVASLGPQCSGGKDGEGGAHSCLGLAMRPDL